MIGQTVSHYRVLEKLGGARQLTRGEAESVYPRWSPDGTSIAYQSRIAGSSNIWIIPVTGGAARKLGGDSVLDATPDWSPDGRWLAFSSNRPRGRDHIWRIPAVGGEPELVSKGPGSRPRWSADGKWVYFLSARDGVVKIWGASVDGKAERAMTNLVGKRGYLEGSVFATDRRHLYLSWNEDLSDIWVMDVTAGRR